MTAKCSHSFGCARIQIRGPFEQSFFMMVHLPYLQPFADINKRTSRLAANLPLFRANLCPLTFLDVPEQAYSRATLGVYEMTRVELLRDLYVWAYERSTQEYLAIKQDLAEPDPLRLAWRDFIKQTLREIITNPELDPLTSTQRSVAARIPEQEQPDVQALIIEELRRLHEGVLARYGLRPSQGGVWLGKLPFRPDRHHLHHLFIRSGFRGQETVYAITLIQLFLGIGRGKGFDRRHQRRDGRV